jgi:hypothetical protein
MGSLLNPSVESQRNQLMYCARLCAFSPGRKNYQSRLLLASVREYCAYRSRLMHRGERYLSTLLFADITIEMTEKELQISLHSDWLAAAQGLRNKRCFVERSRS